MIPLATLGAFGALCLGMVLTPGPNMAYLVSRSICQGRAAGLLSLGGVAVGFVVYMFLAAFGITAVLMAVPYAFEALKIAGALYLAWLAWQALRPGGTSPFTVRTLPADSPRRLFVMGLLTSLLNPKVALLYLSLLPQFVDPARGSVLVQSIGLGVLQICISATVNSGIVLAAGAIARVLAARPRWARVQRWLMGCMLGSLAVRMAVSQSSR